MHHPNLANGQEQNFLPSKNQDQHQKGISGTFVGARPDLDVFDSPPEFGLAGGGRRNAFRRYIKDDRNASFTMLFAYSRGPR